MSKDIKSVPDTDQIEDIEQEENFFELLDEADEDIVPLDDDTFDNLQWYDHENNKVD